MFKSGEKAFSRVEDLRDAPAKDRSLRLDLPVLLPDAPDAADACTGRLIAELTGRDGVARVHVLLADGDQPAKLGIHYDPETLSLGRTKEIAEGAGAQVTRHFGHVLWQRWCFTKDLL